MVSDRRTLLKGGYKVSDTLSFLRSKASALPATPGVYLMKDEGGRIIYVGKSRALKNRVSSYFIGGGKSVKTARMVSLVRDFDYILCDSEIEALTLENLLIKKHSPKYNIKLKDAKSYPYLKVGRGSYPQITVTRERKSDGGRYYGPYSGMSVAKSVHETVLRLFSLPHCKRRFPEDIGRERPCLYAQMGRCIAPCTGNVDEQSYRALVESAEAVLAGRIGTAAAHIEAKMKEAAEAERFESAARLRDSLLALRRLQDRQHVVTDRSVSADAIALCEHEAVTVLACISVREGNMQSKNEFLIGKTELTDDSSLLSFLASYYRDSADIPTELLLGFSASEEERSSLAALLTELAHHKVTVSVPVRGRRRALCKMAEDNARERAESAARELSESDGTLARLALLLGMDALPDRIEAYDVSNLGSEHITASMAVAIGGKTKKSDYRVFRLDTQDVQDDYTAMRSALDRRLSHIGDGSPSLGEMPDLILLDGGIGHVHTVKALLDERGIDVPVFGMVKDDYHKTRVLTDGEHEIGIALDRLLFSFIYKLQEEAHRFAVKHMSAAKRKTLRHSALEDLDGFGKTKIDALYRTYGSLKRMRAATPEELATVKPLRIADARALYAFLHENENENEEDDA